MGSDVVVAHRRRCIHGQTMMTSSYDVGALLLSKNSIRGWLIENDSKFQLNTPTKVFVLAVQLCERRGSGVGRRTLD